MKTLKQGGPGMPQYIWMRTGVYKLQSGNSPIFPFSNKKKYYTVPVLKTRQNHCPSAGRVTFVTCPPWQKVARPHTDFTIKIPAIYEKLPVCRTGWVSYLPAYIIFYPVSGGQTGSIFNTAHTPAQLLVYCDI